MVNKKLLTLQDLFSFYESHFSSNASFSAKDNGGKPIVVQAYDFAEFEKGDTSNGLMYLKFKVCHTGINRNNSRISKKDMEKAMPSLKYRPVLAYIKEDKNGELDFDAHNIELDEDGNVIYVESQVGCFTVDEPVLEYDEEKNKDYVTAYAAIPVDYTETANIISRKNGTKASCELMINEMSYDAKDKVLDLTDFYFNAVTLLGEDIGEGMEGSRADIVSLESFSAEKNSTLFYSKIDELTKTIEEIKEKLFNANIDPSGKEGGEKPMKLEELLAKYGKTKEELNFDYSEMTDKELEAKFVELFEDNQPSDSRTKVCSIKANGNEYTFEVSLEEKIYALESLVNETYSEQDNAYYCVKTYEDYVVMIDYWTGRSYKQSYTCTDDVYSLSGDRVEVYCSYLTKEEQAAIDSLRSNYEAVSETLKKYQDKEKADQKDAIVNDEGFDAIRDSAEFAEIVKNIENYTVEEVQSKCDQLLLDYAKSQTRTYSKKRVSVGSKKEETYSPYGTLFANK